MPSAPAPPSPPPMHRVLAGPGAGKTRLLTNEIRRRLDASGDPGTLLGVTFTRRAAKEMLQRLSTSGTRTPWLGTFHALARRILADLRRLPVPLDLDTLIPEATKALLEGAAPAWLRRVQYVAVDEAQDLDGHQVEFLQALRRHTRNAELLLVGDPDQAIYGFRRASPRYLLDAEAVFHQPCTTLCLAENHRSARQIVETARAILSPIADPQAPCHRLAPMRREAHPAIRHLVSDSPQAEAVRIFEEARTFLALGLPATEIAILVRTRAQMPALQAEANRWGIPLYLPPLRDQLDDGRDTPTPPGTAVQLMTIHQAKGCEWTVVFIAGCQDGLIPHSTAHTAEARFEELRLLYVAVTRAKQLLFFTRHDRPSPFLAPLRSTSFLDPAPPPSPQTPDSGAPPVPQQSLLRRVFQRLRHSLSGQP